MAYRYAIYFAPDLQSLWWSTGSRWLGRCAATGRSCTQDPIAGIDAERLASYTREPRRYGWHATLKAPFVLAEGCSPDMLLARLRELALKFSAFQMPPLQVSVDGGFLALRPQGHTQKIDAIAAACVTTLQALTRPLSPSDLARRREKSLTAKQEQYLQAWSYPWVLDEFSFHMSLTGPMAHIPETDIVKLMQAAREKFESLPACQFTHLSIFVEPEPGADFLWLDQVALKA